VLSLTSVAGLFFLAGADFLGGLQLMIYVGGTVVLLVFGVMLTTRNPFANLKTTAGSWILGVIVGGSLLAVLLQAALSVDRWASQKQLAAASRPEVAPTSAPLGMGLLGVRVDQLQESDAKLRAGMSGYLLPFEVVSVHLVVVLIGAAYLARARRPGKRKVHP
jgi:NADH-quinone oxidoreductase subunit J